MLAGDVINSSDVYRYHKWPIPATNSRLHHHNIHCQTFSDHGHLIFINDYFLITLLHWSEFISFRLYHLPPQIFGKALIVWWQNLMLILGMLECPLVLNCSMNVK